MDKIQTCVHGLVDLVMEIVVNAEALEMINVGHHLSLVLMVLMQHCLNTLEALLEVKIVGERLGLPSRACHRARAEELTAEAASAFSGQPKERWLGGGGEDMGRHQVLSLF